MLSQVADGVWVRQSEWVWSNAVVVRGEGGLVLVDPCIGSSDLEQLADDVDRLGLPVVTGFSTHCHWDHLLWHSRFGDVPRYATSADAEAAGGVRERARTMAADSASGIPLERLGEAARDVDVLVPGTAPWPRVPRSRPASPPTVRTSLRCGQETNRSTRVWTRTGSPAPTRRT